MGKLRVIFVSPMAIAGGGAERVIFDHVRYLDRERFEPYFAVVGPGTFADEARAMGVPTYVAEPHSDAQPLALAREIRRFGQFVRKERIDVVVGNKYRSILYWGLSAARRRPFVWLLHDPHLETSFGRRLMARVVDRLRPGWTVWVTPVAAESYGRRFPHLLGTNQSRISPGTSPEDLQQGADAARARQRWNVPEQAPVFSLFARMQSSKGHLELVAAAALVLAEFPEARFLLCGGTLPGMPPEHEGRVREAARQSGVEERVLFLGVISEPEKRDVLAATTVLVHPAVWEPFGIAVIEGMAVGKPVVVADAVGPASIVEHGTTGLIVPKGDHVALANALLTLLRDPERAAAMGKAGAQRVLERHHSRVAASQLEQIMERLTAAREA